jgi:hypothetical protein
MHLPGINPPNLRRSLIPSTVLTLLMRLGENFKQFLPNSNGFAFVADHFPALLIPSH